MTCTFGCTFVIMLGCSAECCRLACMPGGSCKLAAAMKNCCAVGKEYW